MEMRCLMESPAMSLRELVHGGSRADYICIFMISWYASTTLLRTCSPSSKASSAFCVARMVVCSSSFSPREEFLHRVGRVVLQRFDLNRWRW